MEHGNSRCHASSLLAFPQYGRPFSYSGKESESNDIMLQLEEFSNVHNSDRTSNTTRNNLAYKTVFKIENFRMENFRQKTSEKILSDAFSGISDKKNFWTNTTSKNKHYTKIYVKNITSTRTFECNFR